MFTAVHRIRPQLLVAVHTAYDADGAKTARAARAVNAMLDIELAIMLDTYGEDQAEKVRASERLETIGQLAASIAHELRSPLSASDSSLFLVRRHLAKAGVQDAVPAKHHQRIVDYVDQLPQVDAAALQEPS
jgi:signal transduction histidine kinase